MVITIKYKPQPKLYDNKGCKRKHIVEIEKNFYKNTDLTSLRAFMLWLEGEKTPHQVKVKVK